jgi:hypothetical protein
MLNYTALIKILKKHGAALDVLFPISFPFAPGPISSQMRSFVEGCVIQQCRELSVLFLYQYPTCISVFCLCGASDSTQLAGRGRSDRNESIEFRAH